MKTITSILILLTLSSTAFAANSELEFIENVAKQMRRDHWVNGYQDVHSTVDTVTKSLLNGYVRGEVNEGYENPLNRDEISSLYRCYYKQSCHLYLIQVSSEYYGGYGSESSFILLNPETLKYDEIRHVTYSE